MKGKLIVIEGMDGSGKSTQGEILSNKLNAMNIKSIYTFEPTYSYYGYKLRDSMSRDDLDAEEELSLFINDRKEHIKYMIKPAMEEGYVIVLDRYFYSSIAYQGAKGINVDLIADMHKDFIIKPDLVFIFHLPVEEALDRIMLKRGFADRFENANYLKKVDEIFYSLKEPFIYHVNANRDVEILNEELLSVIEESKILAPNFRL